MKFKAQDIQRLLEDVATKAGTGVDYKSLQNTRDAILEKKGAITFHTD